MTKILPICLICKETPLNGMRDGIMIGGKFICSTCEEDIVNISYHDDSYYDLLNSLKKIWT